MGKFNGKISAEFSPPKTWVLNRGLSFTTNELSDEEINILERVGANIGIDGKITCKKGMKTDLASVPRIVWNIIAPWDVARAAVIHDHLYATLREFYWREVRSNGMMPEKQMIQKQTWAKARAISDKVFLLGMHAADPAIPQWKKQSAYWSVRSFGRWPASANEFANE
jgi:hypothetical protein